MKVMSIFGTRPEMIKMWGTLRKLDNLNFDHIMVHTGQNYTPELKDFFFNYLGLRKPDYELDIDTSSYSVAMGRCPSLLARASAASTPPAPAWPSPRSGQPGRAGQPALAGGGCWSPCCLPLVHKSGITSIDP